MDKEDRIELGRQRGSGKKTDGRRLRGGKGTGGRRKQGGDRGNVMARVEVTRKREGNTGNPMGGKEAGGKVMGEMETFASIKTYSHS